MKKTIAITSALAAVSSLATAEIKINDFLSLEGFVDMSYSHTDIDSDSNLVDSDTENSFDIDQVEIDWLFSFDKVSARIDLAHEGSDSSFDTDVEQAYVTYDLGNGSAITAGRYQSMLGLEAFCKLRMTTGKGGDRGEPAKIYFRESHCACGHWQQIGAGRGCNQVSHERVLLPGQRIRARRPPQGIRNHARRQRPE